MKHRRGFMLFDAILALGLLAGVAGLLIVTKSTATRAARDTEDRQAAVRLAERYLIDAANKPATTQPAGDADFVVNDLPTAAPAGWKWVAVHAAVHGHAGEVVGLVRRGS